MQPILTFTQILVPLAHSSGVALQEPADVQYRMEEIFSEERLQRIVQSNADLSSQITALHQQTQQLYIILQWQKTHSDGLAQQYNHLLTLREAYQNAVQRFRRPPPGFEHAPH